MVFHDRRDAGRQLAQLLIGHREAAPLVLGLPRGGVPVAAEVARALGAPLEVLLVRKLGAPMQPELAVGAIAEGGAVFLDAHAVRALAISTEELSGIAERESVELERRVRLYRQGRPLPGIAGREVILVDDGIATGATARAAVRTLRELGAGKVVLAAPVIAASTLEALRGEVDQLLYVSAPGHFGAVGCWYREFPQTTDAEVLALLGRGPSRFDQEAVDPGSVSIPIIGGALEALLAVPDDPRGVIIFAHGSGSSRHSPRNQHVARVLQASGFATLLPDLLTEHEEVEDELSGHLRFDIDLLAERLSAVTRWTDFDARLRQLSIGYFGASTGAAAALVAAADLPDRVRAIVSRGGRPDLAGPTVLVRVEVPTLLIVGERDPAVIELNREALRHLSGAHQLVIVPGATHLFEEPGALDAVARLAARWFERHLAPMETHAWPEGRL